MGKIPKLEIKNPFARRVDPAEANIAEPPNPSSDEFAVEDEERAAIERQTFEDNTTQQPQMYYPQQVRPVPQMPQQIPQQQMQQPVQQAQQPVQQIQQPVEEQPTKVEEKNKEVTAEQLLLDHEVRLQRIEYNLRLLN